MKLFHSPTSPYVRKVMVVAHLTGQTDALELHGAPGTPLAQNPETVAANPLGKVPCLVTDEGLALYDSRVICRYLDARGSGGLYPVGAAEFPVIVTEALCDGILDAALLAVYERRLRPAEMQFEPWIGAQTGKVRAALPVLEKAAAGFGETVLIDQVAAGCTLGYLDLRFPDLGWREAAPTLARWFAGFGETAAMAATRPEG